MAGAEEGTEAAAPARGRTPAMPLLPAPGPPPCPCCPDPDPPRMAGADPWDVAMDLARERLAPPPLASLPPGTMLAVAAGPGKNPEEWQPEGAWPFWYAWPHAAGAVHAEEMTAGQLRVCLAARDAILAREVSHG